jgi:O-antigen ligase
MSFRVYLLYLVLLVLRPIDLFAPDLGAYRPLLVVWAVAFMLAVSDAIRNREIAARPASVLTLGAFVVVIALSLIANGWLGGAPLAVADFSPTALLFVLTIMNLRSVDRIKATTKVLLWSVVALAFLSILAYHYGFWAEKLVLRQNAPPEGSMVLPIYPAEDIEHLYLWRVRGLGFLNDPNDFGQLMVMVLPFLWGLMERGRRMRNVIVAIPGVVLLYAIYLTQSRGAMLGCLVLFAIALYRVIGLVRLGLLLAIVGGAAGSLLVGGRGFTTQEASADERIEAWWAGVQMLYSHPVFGVGYGGFQEHHYITAHNSFVLCFAELGLVGYFFWVGMLVLAYKGVSQVLDLAPAGSEERKQALQFRSSFAGFMVCAWFLSRAYQPGLYLLLGMCASLTWCVHRQVRNTSAASGGVYSPWVGSTLLTMVLTYGMVRGFVLIRQLGL